MSNTTYTPAQIAAAIALLDGAAATKAPRSTKASKGNAGKARLALKNHKLAGAIPAGVSVKQAVEQGLMNADGTLPGAKAGKGKKAKGAKAPKTVNILDGGLPFKVLQECLREHKAAGVITGAVSVRQAVEAGLMDIYGDATGTQSVKSVKAPKAGKKGKKGKKAKAEKVVAEVVADGPAKVRAADGPRRSDGTITPVGQWEQREALAMTGQFTRQQIDAIVEPERALA